MELLAFLLGRIPLILRGLRWQVTAIKVRGETEGLLQDEGALLRRVPLSGIFARFRLKA